MKHYLREYKSISHDGFRIKIPELHALARSIIELGVIGKERFQYWKIFFWSLFLHPRLFPHAITLAIYGYHFRKTIQQYFV